MGSISAGDAATLAPRISLEIEANLAFSARVVVGVTPRTVACGDSSGVTLGVTVFLMVGVGVEVGIWVGVSAEGGFASLGVAVGVGISVPIRGARQTVKDRQYPQQGMRVVPS